MVATGGCSTLRSVAYLGYRVVPQLESVHALRLRCFYLTFYHAACEYGCSQDDATHCCRTCSIQKVLNSHNLMMVQFKDDYDDAPAVEINHDMDIHVSEELMKRDMKKGKHGPSVIRENPIVSSMYDCGAQRLYVGMLQGDIIYWDLRLARGSGISDAKFRSHSAHRTVGRHAVRSCIKKDTLVNVMIVQMFWVPP